MGGGAEWEKFERERWRGRDGERVREKVGGNVRVGDIGGERERGGREGGRERERWQKERVFTGTTESFVSVPDMADAF